MKAIRFMDPGVIEYSEIPHLRFGMTKSWHRSLMPGSVLRILNC